MSESVQPTQTEQVKTVEEKKEEIQEEIETSEKVEKGKEQEEPSSEQFIEDNIELAQQLKSEGNQLFKAQQYCQAIGKYQQGLQYANKKENKLRSILYSNISICFSKEQNYKNSLSYCKKAVDCDPSYMKAQMNLASCFQKTDNLEEALGQYKKILQFFPNDVKTMIKIKQLEKAIEQKNEKQKKEVIDGLKNIGNSVLGYFGLSLDNFKLQQGANGGYNVSFKQ